jgi:DNA-binding NarL/FixJ family response regulator
MLWWKRLPTLIVRLADALRDALPQEGDLTMISPHPLDRLIEQETFAEIVAMLTPKELVVAALRLEGLSDTQIGALLGSSPSAVRQRLAHAQMRIVRERPELAVVLEERQHSNSFDDEALPLEWGWLVHLQEEEEEHPPLAE